MYLIDTDILIWALRGNKAYIDLLQKLKDESALSISSVTVGEIYKNIFPAGIVKTENLLNEFQIWDVTVSIAKQAGLYWQQYSRTVKNLSLLDCMIAATVHTHDLTLISLNLKHYPMKDIDIYKLKTR
jgi:predicted nucleic acid-binding protein